MSTPHNIWKGVGKDPVGIRAGEIKARLATQMYMLQTTKAKYSFTPKCNMCNLEDEDLYHYVIDCRQLNGMRIRHLEKLIGYLNMIRGGLF